jgi:hypothetical protein
MVKQITYLKKQWFKNDDDKGGAMKQAIDNCLANEVVIHSHTKKMGRLDTSMKPEMLLKMLEKNYGIYERITRFPHKVYFDIDAPIERPLNEVEVKEFLEKTRKPVEELFPNADIAISGSVTDKKISYHFVLNNYVIHNEDERQLIKSITQYIHNNYDKNYDWKVYNKNRQMKAINQSKEDGRVQEIIENENWKKHMITCYINEYPLPLPEFKEEVKEAIMIQKAKGKFDIGSLPKLNKKTPKEIIWNKITAKEVIDLLPCSKDFNHDYTHKVARFCHTNNIEFEYFLSWISQKHTNMTSEIKNKWLFHWNNLHKYPPCNMESMKSILAYYYPDIKKDIHMREFKELFELPNNINLTKIDRLDQEHYNDNFKATILHLGMGSGKTAQTIDYLHKEINFCWVGHRQSLHQNTLQRIRSSGLECVDYQTGTSKTKSKIYSEATALSICIHSLHYLSEATEFRCVVIDEIESLLDSFIGDFMGDKKSANFNNLCKLIKTSSKVILIDAFITNRTIEFIRSIDKNITIDYVTSEVKLNKTLVFKNSVREGIEDDYDEIEDTKNMSINQICKSLNDDKKVFIFYPYKKDMEQMLSVIEYKTGKKGICYNADVDDSVKNTLKTVNDVWSQQDFVITNTCITCGVNYDLEMFDNVWIFLAGFVKPREAIQVSARIRYLKSNTIFVSFLGNLKNPTVYKDDTSIIKNKVYTNVYNNALIEDKAPRRKAFEFFCGKAGYKMTKEDMRINKEICNEMKKLFENTDTGILYENIEVINNDRADELQNKVCGHTSTMYERLCLQKYYFLQKFDANVDYEFLAETWNKDYIFFFDKYKSIINTENVFKEIQETNKWETIFPTSKFKTIKIDSETLEKIFVLYKFRTLTKCSNKNLIFKDIMNTTFEKIIILTTQDDNRNVSWGLNEDFVEIQERLIEATNHLI